MNIEGKYNSELAAKRASGKTEGNCIVEFRGENGKRTYDYFPQGHPIGEFESNGSGKFIKATNHKIVARAYRKANGDIVWKS